MSRRVRKVRLSVGLSAEARCFVPGSGVAQVGTVGDLRLIASSRYDALQLSSLLWDISRLGLDAVVSLLNAADAPTGSTAEAQESIRAHWMREDSK